MATLGIIFVLSWSHVCFGYFPLLLFSRPLLEMFNAFTLNPHLFSISRPLLEIFKALISTKPVLNNHSTMYCTGMARFCDTHCRSNFTFVAVAPTFTSTAAKARLVFQDVAHQMHFRVQPPQEERTGLPISTDPRCRKKRNQMFWGIILESCWKHFGIRNHLADHLGIIVESSWGHLEIISGSLGRHLEIIRGSSGENLEDVFEFQNNFICLYIHFTFILNEIESAKPNRIQKKLHLGATDKCLM